MSKKGFNKAKKYVEISVGESLRIIRELQEMSQNDLAEITGIPQSTISAIEKGWVNLGIERAKVFGRALRVHPAVLVFPGWDVEKETAASWKKPIQALAIVERFNLAFKAKK